MHTGVREHSEKPSYRDFRREAQAAGLATGHQLDWWLRYRIRSAD